MVEQTEAPANPAGAIPRQIPATRAPGEVSAAPTPDGEGVAEVEPAPVLRDRRRA